MLEVVLVIFGNITCFYMREGIVSIKSKIVSVEFESVSMESGSVSEYRGNNYEFIDIN
jgi:hypothetical protein